MVNLPRSLGHIPHIYTPCKVGKSGEFPTHVIRVPFWLRQVAKVPSKPFVVRRWPRWGMG